MKTYNYNNIQVLSMVLLRVLIGWHLLYEGVVKVLDTNWTSADFLKNSWGPFSGFFKYLASDNTLLYIVDLMNQWVLIFIGLSLILGFFTRTGVVMGIVLLILYYLASPPFSGNSPAANVEGSYLIVNKNLVEIGALFVLLTFRTSHLYGLDRFFEKS
jgi:thiosulfate dehydrogenase [quinone] large subunit